MFNRTQTAAPVNIALGVKMILDMACGSRMFWFDKRHKETIYGDIRRESHTLCDGRHLEIKPDCIFDFRSLPFRDSMFRLVVFDPPHLVVAGKNGWQFKKYGRLSKTWRVDLKQGFKEAFRVLTNRGILVFKWNETHILTSEILKLANRLPLFGHPSGKRANTHWTLFENT